MYRDSVISMLIDRFNADGPKLLKGKYFYGDPLIVNQASLPAVFITKDDTDITFSDNVYDEQLMRFVINGVFDLKRDFNKSFDTITGTNQLYDVFEGRDENGNIRTDTLIWQIRKNQVLGERFVIDIDTPSHIDYGLGIEKRGQNVFTTEAVIRITVRHSQLTRGQ